MTEQCKHQIKDVKNSTLDNDVFRNCKMKVVRDGYCTRHDPKIIEAAVAEESQREIMRGIRDAEHKEESVVGAFMRLRKKEEFDAILTEIRDAKELANQMRYM